MRRLAIVAVGLALSACGGAGATVIHSNNPTTGSPSVSTAPCPPNAPHPYTVTPGGKLAPCIVFKR